MWARASLALDVELVVGGALMGAIVDVPVVDFEDAQGCVPLVGAFDGVA